MSIDAIQMLYVMIGVIVVIMLAFGITLFIISRNKKKNKKVSIGVGGADQSEVSDYLREKFRNERANQRHDHIRKFTYDDE